MAILFSFTGEVIEPRVDMMGNPCPIAKRDIESDRDCADFEPGKPDGDDFACEGDGHYMCAECKIRRAIPRYENQLS
ncbi:hypothetical protein GCM10027299_09470 [Larkinella ripae]